MGVVLVYISGHLAAVECWTSPNMFCQWSFFVVAVALPFTVRHPEVKATWKNVVSRLSFAIPILLNAVRGPHLMSQTNGKDINHIMLLNSNKDEANFSDWINVAVYILVVVLVAAQLKIIRMSQLCAPTVLWFSDLITLFAKPVSIFFGIQTSTVYDTVAIMGCGIPFGIYIILSSYLLWTQENQGAENAVASDAGDKNTTHTNFFFGVQNIQHITVQQYPTYDGTGQRRFTETIDSDQTYLRRRQTEANRSTNTTEMSLQPERISHEDNPLFSIGNRTEEPDNSRWRESWSEDADSISTTGGSHVQEQEECSSDSKRDISNSDQRHTYSDNTRSREAGAPIIGQLRSRPTRVVQPTGAASSSDGNRLLKDIATTTAKTERQNTHKTSKELPQQEDKKLEERVRQLEITENDNKGRLQGLENKTNHLEHTTNRLENKTKHLENRFQNGDRFQSETETLPAGPPVATPVQTTDGASLAPVVFTRQNENTSPSREYQTRSSSSPLDHNYQETDV
ncbi:uncharacterized protein LOC134182001 isoform X2 [Corticium candelabrum]|uniref:uncharacterized protein LOC134182001 isoform X2 n=1 Tax=Corticium candelabrum TaxID=121492 RepID=UPI002E253118|nr:uncharacterized protein LOC134182001 isoform X2 [Corticium candelabrum]